LRGRRAELVQRARALEIGARLETSAVSPTLPKGQDVLTEVLRSGARRLLVTHRPSELPTPDDFELAYDGLALDV